MAVRAALLAARAQGRGASAGEEPPRCEIQASLPQNLNAGEGCGRQPWLRTVTPLDGEGIEGESGGSRYFQLHTRRSETRIDLEQFGGRAAGSIAGLRLPLPPWPYAPPSREWEGGRWGAGEEKEREREGGGGGPAAPGFARLRTAAVVVLCRRRTAAHAPRWREEDGEFRRRRTASASTAARTPREAPPPCRRRADLARTNSPTRTI